MITPLKNGFDFWVNFLGKVEHFLKN